MSRNYKGYIIIAVIAILVAVGIYLSVHVPQHYSGVYLRTGENYIGKISYFPKMIMRDAYYLQPAPVNDPTEPTGVGPSETIGRLIPISSATWSPNKLFFNKDHVVFIGRVGENSATLQALIGAQMDN